MNVCQDQGREAGTIESEDAQKTLCSQMEDTSMTTVKRKRRKKKTTKKPPHICFVFILLHLKLFLPRQPVVL